MKAKYLTFLLLFFLSFGADQGSKMWARKTLKPEGYPNAYPTAKVVIKNVFDYRYSENPGSAFGFFRNMNGAKHLLFAVGVACLFIIGLWLVKVPGQAPWLGAKLGLLAGGAVGNMADRIQYSKVTDFIVWKITTSSRVYEWPTFNIADAALVIGVGLILIDRPRDPMPPEPVTAGDGKAA